MSLKPFPRTPPFVRSRVLVLVLTGLPIARMVPGPGLAHAQGAGSEIEYAENGTRPVGVFHAYDQDGDPIEWSLGGPDAALFTIAGGVLAFRASPDYEEPQPAAAGGPLRSRNVYRVTIEANGGVHDVAPTVMDVDEAGAVTIDRPQPQVSRPLVASLSDEDEGVSGQRWQWARSKDRSAWTDIFRAMAQARVDHSTDKAFRSFLTPNLLILDDLGLHRLTQQQCVGCPSASVNGGSRPWPLCDSGRSVPYCPYCWHLHRRVAGLGYHVGGTLPNGRPLEGLAWALMRVGYWSCLAGSPSCAMRRPSLPSLLAMLTHS